MIIFQLINYILPITRSIIKFSIKQKQGPSINNINKQAKQNLIFFKLT